MGISVEVSIVSDTQSDKSKKSLKPNQPSVTVFSSTHLGKCVRMSVRFSGSSLSFSTLNFSRS